MKACMLRYFLIVLSMRFAHAFAPPNSRKVLFALRKRVLITNTFVQKNCNISEYHLTRCYLLGERKDETLLNEHELSKNMHSMMKLKNTRNEIAEVKPKNHLPIYTVIALLCAFLISYGEAGDITDLSVKAQSFFHDPKSALEAVVENVKDMGPMGFVYFGVIYTIAEILAIPAIPLTASAGYLFGVKDGTAIVLLSASIAAAASFVIGRTFLRSYVEGLLEDYPDFKKIDKAIGSEGFKLILLLRLSPIFPFALSNYLYGVTSIEFWPYFWGTMIGFLPGTVAYVYTGEIGKSLTLETASAEPWYIYAGGLALLVGLIKIASDVASSVIQKAQQDN